MTVNDTAAIAMTSPPTMPLPSALNTWQPPRQIGGESGLVRVVVDVRPEEVELPVLIAFEQLRPHAEVVGRRVLQRQREVGGVRRCAVERGDDLIGAEPLGRLQS